MHIQLLLYLYYYYYYLNHSCYQDSFQDELLAPPVYTRPSIFNGWEVPKILTSGDLKAIEKWREKKAIENTLNKRPLLGDQKKEKN